MFNRFSEAKLSAEPEPLVPPHFSACVAHLRAVSMSRAEGAPAPARLRSRCQTRYQGQLRWVLERLIADEWLIGGARELGVPVPDVAFETGAELASAAIRRAIKGRVRPITREQITSYYRRHRFEYLVTAERDLKIARTMTAASAAAVRAKIASGKSFASVVRQLPVRQPVDSHEGLVLRLKPHEYGEPELNQAIFTATPHVLSEPIDTWFGYLVFEVTRIRFERERPLREVQASIRQHLAGPPQERALAAFSKRWNATWTAQTDCSPGFVVPGCRQFKGTPGELITISTKLH